MSLGSGKPESDQEETYSGKRSTDLSLGQSSPGITDPLRVKPFNSLPFGEGDHSFQGGSRGGPRVLGYLTPHRFDDYHFDGLGSEMRPYLLNLEAMYLDELTNIEKYSHITYLNLTYNRITNFSASNLSFMQNLITLVLDHNKLSSTSLPTMNNLEYLSINKNYLARIDKINQPKLHYLFLNENFITQVRNVTEDDLPNLIILSVCRCRLQKIKADYSINLQRLYLSYNKIKKVEGLSNLINLKVLHLRGNQISKLSFSGDLMKLNYLNLRENDISEEKELQQLRVLPLLRTVIINQNPLSETLEERIREEVLLNAPKLWRINKNIVEDEEIENIQRKLEELRLEEERRREMAQRRPQGEGAPFGEGAGEEEGTASEQDEDS